MRDRLEVTRSNSDENHPLASQSDLVTYVIKRKRGTPGSSIDYSPRNDRLSRHARC